MKIIKWLDQHLEEALLVLFSTIMVTVIFLQVVMRTLDNSLSWSEELARYSFIWLVYIGISYGVKKQRHIKVDVALLLLKEKGRILLTIVANLLFIGFSIFVIYYGYSIATQLLSFGQKSPALQIPMGLVYMATPIGMGLTVIRLVQNLILLIKSFFEGEEDITLTEREKVQENYDD
ncbi:TRAP transporter small permease [Aquibacillus sp. 3ASR75-11]|uniref:TRAP transporter small permease n=1 Tax=Terrihalobacillus insolitus TaxID=2950438 RepID=A0A9X4AM40_9BACI|nr:TRAP transporter small permease [Terrihalobacillus insolitus]MDC3412191.1 TRAP transporter small permease [Terrihalobacillus insolitus]MDC3423115.1 TRAP transporter small permease [Terrihalobacillus insolitus]